MNQIVRVGATFTIGYLMMYLSVLGQDTDVIQKKAFVILESKCNFCHSIDYPKNVFEYSNMNESAKKIYKQVFVKEKMPKGDSILLTQVERSVLLKWLNIHVEVDD